MIVKGRCRGNGAQLANYLFNSLDNDRAEFVALYGASSNAPRRALLEMSLSSEITGRTKSGLYHMQLSPCEEEAASMTWEQKKRAVEITAEKMGLQGHKWALFEHEKDGRTHMHLVFERYDHDTGRMWDDNRNYEKHLAASRQMEREFGWQLTHENKRTLDKDLKGHITDMWLESKDGAEFVRMMDKAGFEVTQGIDRRPFQLVDQYGNEHDLSRQLQGIRQGDVSEYLNSVRKELRPTTEASQERRAAHQHQTIENQRENMEHSDNLRELSDSQDLAEAMRQQYREAANDNNLPSLPQEPEQKSYSENLHELSERQQIAVDMLEAYRQRQQEEQERQQRLKVMREQAAEQVKKQKQEKSLTDQADEMLEYYRKRQQERGRERGGLEY